MVKGRKRKNEKTAQNLIKKTLETAPRVLALVGKPLYLILFYFIIAFLFFFFIVGKSARVTSQKLVLQISFKKPHFQFRLPKFKIKLPHSFLALVILGLTFWFLILKDLPSPKDLVDRDQEVSTKIYDRNSVLLYTIYKDQNRTPVELSKIPQQVRLATLAAEDAEFYSHPGFSIRGIIRSILKNIQKGEVTGGSTITQQLVKNALLSPEKTIIRKLKEVILSVRTEMVFTKDQILEMYLNEVSYGGTAYGIQEAARVYLNKNVDELSSAEAALLAGLPKSPTKFSPFGPNPQLATERQREVLHLMAANGFISKEQEEEALSAKVEFAQNRTDIKAPHFVFYVRSLLVDKYGEEVVEKGGLEVTTTLDYSIQLLAEEAVKKEVNNLFRLNVTNGAAVVLDPKTGEILSMVGSKDYFDTKADGNVNVTMALRQPGSSIKVINYAYALSHNYTPATMIADTPTAFPIPGQEIYRPKNYDDKFRGNITLRSALAESRNIPAVKVLNSYGVVNMIDLGRKMGITSWGDPSNYGLSLTLGGGEVRLIDLAQAYATVANYGKRPDLIAIKKVTNYKGKVLEQDGCPNPNCESETVLDPRVAFLLIDILRDNSARAPSFGTRSALVIPGHGEVAVKTGTSNNLKDNLTVGFNQNYLVAVWVGNNNGSPMARVASGLTGASPIWNSIMRGLLANTSNHSWEAPQGLIQLPICPYTGTLACSGCPVKMEWFLEENRPTKACQKPQILPEAASTP